MPANNKNKTTILTLNNHKKTGQPTVLVTAYDYPQGLLADQAGVDCILVGDSLGMTTLGLPTTIGVSMNQMISASEAVVRGAKNAFVIGDMPFMSYQISNESAIENAGRFIVAGCDCVKVEGCSEERVKAITGAGILLMGHIGLTPQSRAKLGGYRVQGKTKKDYEVILDQAMRLQDAGCCSLLLEAMPREPAGLIAEKLTIPVYGIGAGDNVDGQLVILHDLIGLFFEFKSKFVKRYLEGGELIKRALQDYANEVRQGAFPSEEHFYKIDDTELEKMLGDNKWKYTHED